MLLSAAGSMRFWLYTAPADMRKGFDGLAGLVRNGLGDDLLRCDVFVFISRSLV
jgi:transposase